MFSLSDILLDKNITIQCHDNPDADAVASAFGVYSYLKHKGVTANIIYSGRFTITKPNLLEMLVKLSIPIEYIEPKDTEFTPIDTLVVVDGQYGAGNVTKFPAKKVVVIDHHKEEKLKYHTGVINSLLGSCSTLVWDLLRKENFPFKKHQNLSTALYFGLYSDTNSLSEIHHPLDKDMRDDLHFNRHIIRLLQNTNLSLRELEIAGTALATYTNNHHLRYTIFRSEPCDPNILGFISDLALQVDTIDACVVYNNTPDGAKLSIRSCTREVMASDLAEFLTAGVGSGGGHIHKAGGFIAADNVHALGYDMEKFIDTRTREYFDSYDTIDHADHDLNIENMPMYMKKKIPIGYVLSTDIFEKNTPIIIRTLEGDAETFASDDIYIMVGILGEAYPMQAEKFNKAYEKIDGGLEKDFSYSPTARSRITGEVKDISDFIKPCVALGTVHIHAIPIERNTKVFTAWHMETYMLGKPGDYLAVRSEDYSDVYIIRRDIFFKTYELL